MNKTKYKEVFSKVHPSDETIERIFEMTNQKYNKSIKTLAIAMALIAVLCSFGIVAYASTDGEIKETISNAVETVKKEITVLVNGETATAVLTSSNDDTATYRVEDIDEGLYVEVKMALENSLEN